MYSRAAFAAASRAAAASSPTASVVFNLTSPHRPRPIAFGEDVTAGPAPFPDLFATSPPSRQEVLTPASSLSSDQEAFRRGLFTTLQSASTSSAATGAVRTCGATAHAIAPKVTVMLGSQVLPMVSAAQFVSFFCSAILLGPKSPPPVSAQPGVRWLYVKLVEAAVAYWQVARGGRAVFDSCWAPRMCGLLGWY